MGIIPEQFGGMAQIIIIFSVFALLVSILSEIIQNNCKKKEKKLKEEAKW